MNLTLNYLNRWPSVFENKIAVITGSGRGIGRAIALHFAHLGANIVVNYFRHRISAEKTAQNIRELGQHAWVVKADIGQLSGIEYLFSEIDKQIADWPGPAGIDFLIHNAASGYNRPVLEQKPRGWDWTMNINARSLLFMAQRAAELMEKRGGGYIVSLSSPGSVRVLPDYVVVGASKAALESF
jgi:enoyl-[acyl-carrier protein] reductase III